MPRHYSSGLIESQRTKLPRRAAVRDDDGSRTTQVRRPSIPNIGIHEFDLPRRARPLRPLLATPSAYRLPVCLPAVPPWACVCELVDALDLSQPNSSRHSEGLPREVSGCADLPGDLRRLRASRPAARRVVRARDQDDVQPLGPIPSPSPLLPFARSAAAVIGGEPMALARLSESAVQSEVAVASFSRRCSSRRSRWSTAVQSSCDVQMESRRLVSYPRSSLLMTHTDSYAPGMSGEAAGGP